MRLNTNKGGVEIHCVLKKEEEDQLNSAFLSFLAQQNTTISWIIHFFGFCSAIVVSKGAHFKNISKHTKCVCQDEKECFENAYCMGK